MANIPLYMYHIFFDFFFKLFYLFILFLAALSLRCYVWAFSSWRRAGATLHCGARASHCGGSSCCRARALGAQASVVVAHGLSCSVACGIFLDQGSNPCAPHWQADSQPLHHQGSPFFDFFYWSLVDLQCCINFCCTAKWFSYTHIHILFYVFFPLWFISGYWI